MRSDFELLEAWGAADREAGNELFLRHFKPLFRFFRNKINEGAEDLVQQTFLACVEGRERFRKESNFRTFLFAVARNILFNEYRRRRARGETPIDFLSSSAVDLGPSPSAVVAKRAEQRLLLEALRSIPLDYQVALELNLWEGMSGPELAEVLEIAEPGVRSRLRRAKEALRKKVEEIAASPEDLTSTMSNLDDWAASLREMVEQVTA